MLKLRNALPVIVVLLVLLLPVAAVNTLDAYEDPGTDTFETYFLEKDSLDTANVIQWDQFAEDGFVEILILLREQSDTRAAASKVRQELTALGKMAPGSSFKVKDEVAIAVVDSLQNVAKRTQEPLLAFLDDKQEKGLVEEFNSYFIVNTIYARVSVEVIDDIYSFPVVHSIKLNESYEVPGLPAPETMDYDLLISAVEWNIDRIKAPEVWAMGIDGSGVVVGIIDSGVELNHETLLHNYRGYNPSGNHDHAYNWYDPWYQNRPVPDDKQGHGTHVAGIVLGSDLQNNNQVGVAPGAKWIAARGLNDENKWELAEMLKAMQFMLAPTPNHDGTGTPDPTRAPDVVNNSWGATVNACEPDHPMVLAVKSWSDAGILPVFSSGNTGPDSDTINFPTDSEYAFTVGATNINNALASFSSRGPGSCGTFWKPEISAPGVGIRSSYPGNSYKNIDGTSMAAPHVTGVAALLLQSNPNLTVTELRNTMTETAVPLVDSAYPTSPNYGYGYGLVNALAAVTGEKDPELPAVKAAHAWVNMSGIPEIPQGPVSISIQDGKLNSIKSDYGHQVTGADYVDDTWFAVGSDYTGYYSLYEINQATGGISQMGYMGYLTSAFTGLAYDLAGNNLYASAYDYYYNSSFLYVFDGHADQFVMVGAITNDWINGIAADTSGNLYGVGWSESNDNLYLINKSTGAGSVIGSLGINTFYFFQDIGFDRDNDRLYGTLWIGDTGGGFYQINTATGNATLVNGFDAAIGGLAIPYGQEQDDDTDIDPGTIPEVPNLLSPQDGSTIKGGSVTFQWQPSTGATQYNIQVFRLIDEENAIKVIDETLENTTSFTSTDIFIDDGSQYLWTVLAGNDHGWSEPSDLWMFICDESGEPTGPEDPDCSDSPVALYWQNTETGLRYVYFYDGTGTDPVAMGGIGIVPSTWNIVDAGDLDGDGKTDIVWHNTETGLLYAWLMDGLEVIGMTGLGQEANTTWKAAALGDMNGNGSLDIIWENSANGNRLVWYMEGTAITGFASLPSRDPAWSIVAAADMNSSGHTDLLWQKEPGAEREIWLMEGLEKKGSVTLGPDLEQQWRMVAAGDFNASGDNDIIWENRDTGLRYIWFMDGTGSGQPVAQGGLGIFDLSWQIAGLR